jgi:hypothetical protein
LGENDTCFIIHQAGKIAARVKRWVRARKNRIKGERKVERNQSNEHLCTT